MHRTSASRPAPLDFRYPPAYSIYDIGRRSGSGTSSPLPPPTQPYLEPLIRDGLRTPPEDGMGTTFQHPQYSNYAPRSAVSFQAADRSSGHGATYALANSHTRSQSNLSQPPLSSSTNVKYEAPASYAPHSRPPSPQRSNGQSAHVLPGAAPQQQASNNDLIMPNLQIPPTINSSGGSLAEFAAQITCLFWFESTDILKDAERVTPTTVVPRLKAEALPSVGFRKWVVTILSTTQVTQNVILLALLFIYRLKKINPAVKGRSGSEYRLLTVALMLGNKFLDDNTYTNKTWAEVSGISVAEIHVMEVEFLSNMRYSLLASEEQWKEWQRKLSQFWIYCDNAAKSPPVQYTPHGVPVLQSTLPSPPTSLQSSPPSTVTAYPMASGNLNGNSRWPDLQSHSPSRKRSFDGDLEEPAAKRVSRLQGIASTPYSLIGNPSRHEPPRLPVPNLSISTTLPMAMPASNGYSVSAGPLQNVPLLPPLNGRAMSAVYPPTSQSWTPHLPLLTPTGPPPPHVTSGYSTPTRRNSPHSVQELLSLGSSPLSAHFPQNLAHISPSLFLQQRSSPYKPVRHVNTLLYPPPSASMHDYSANIDHLHYQPLGKRNDYRPGVVPHYTPQPPYQYDGPVPRQPNFNLG